jgi:hypothetical protein
MSGSGSGFGSGFSFLSLLLGRFFLDLTQQTDRFPPVREGTPSACFVSGIHNNLTYKAL